jgi:hypothetical protein
VGIVNVVRVVNRALYNCASRLGNACLSSGGLLYIEAHMYEVRPCKALYCILFETASKNAQTLGVNPTRPPPYRKNMTPHWYRGHPHPYPTSWATILSIPLQCRNTNPTFHLTYHDLKLKERNKYLSPLQHFLSPGQIPRQVRRHRTWILSQTLRTRRARTESSQSKRAKGSKQR